MVNLHSVDDLKKFIKDEFLSGHQNLDQIAFEIFSKTTNQVLMLDLKLVVKLGNGIILSICGGGSDIYRGVRFSVDYVEGDNNYQDFWF